MSTGGEVMCKTRLRSRFILFPSGYEEVISPNIFNLDLWVQSGHAQHYKDNMFTFTVEEQEWGKSVSDPGVSNH